MTSIKCIHLSTYCYWYLKTELLRICFNIKQILFVATKHKKKDVYMHSTFKLVFENTFFQPVMLFIRDISEIWLLPWWSAVKNMPANADVGLIPGLGRSPGEGNGNPLQGSWLGNPRTEENSIAPWVIVHRVTKELYVAEQLNNRDLIIYNF